MKENDKRPVSDLQRIRALMFDLAASGPLTVDRVARNLGVSSRTLQRRLEASRMTFRELAGEVRLEVAARLLKAGDLNVAEIAARLGYSSHGSFTRAFSRWTGEAPSRFRTRAASLTHPR